MSLLRIDKFTLKPFRLLLNSSVMSRLIHVQVVLLSVDSSHKKRKQLNNWLEKTKEKPFFAFLSTASARRNLPSSHPERKLEKLETTESVQKLQQIFGEEFLRANRKSFPCCCAKLCDAVYCTCRLWCFNNSHFFPHLTRARVEMREIFISLFIMRYFYTAENVFVQFLTNFFARSSLLN